MTPNQWLQVDELIVNDQTTSALEVAQKELGTIPTI